MMRLRIFLPALLAVAAFCGAPARAADQLIPPGKCPFALAVTPSMRGDGDPFGKVGATSTSYRATEETEAIRVSFTQRSGAARIVYTIRCSKADPVAWLRRFGGDPATVCKGVNTFPDAERKGNAWCRAGDADGRRTVVSGTWSKAEKGSDDVRGRSRFTVAQAGVGLLSVRIAVTSKDAGQARKLADELAATVTRPAP